MPIIWEQRATINLLGSTLKSTGRSVPPRR